MNNISICIITKNESKNILRCLTPLSAYDFELIVVDTGSTDRTKEIALSQGAKVYDFTWCNDFSAARNFSISKASNDWILVLDADEYLTSMDVAGLLQFMQDYPDYIGRIERHSGDYEGNLTIDAVERFFDRRIYHYERPIHEQVLRMDRMPVKLQSVPVIVEHSGYSTEEIANQKAKRNIDLLVASLDCGYADCYTYFQIGQSYFMIKDFSSALSYFEKALDFDIDPKSEYVQMLMVSCGYALIYSDRVQDAIDFLLQSYSYFQNYGDYVFLLGCCYIRTGEYIKAVQQFVQATTLTEYKTEGVTTYLALYNLGLLYLQLGEKKMAISFLENSRNYPPSETLLKDLLSQS